MYSRKRFRKAAAAYMEMKAASKAYRRRRPLDHGDLRLLILSLIAEEPRHGYDIIRQIEDRSAGAYKPSAGVIYPALAVIQDQGLAKVKKVEGKRVFRITAEGEAELEAHADLLAKIEAKLEALTNAETELDPNDVRAASQSLRHTIFKVVAEDWPNTEKYARIVDILKQAQSDIAHLGGQSGETAH